MSLQEVCDNYVYPWESLTFQKRLSLLRSGRQNIIYIYNSPDSSTFRYRVFNVFQSMENSELINISFFFQDEIPRLSKHIDKVSIIIFCRVYWSYEMDGIIGLAKSRNIKMIYDIDDGVIDVTKIPYVMNTLDISPTMDTYTFWFSYVSRLFFTASKCDSYIGTNEYLKNYLENLFQKQAFIIPNYLNRDQLELSLELNKYPLKKCGDEIYLGYFSGTPSHNKDFQVISRDLADLLSENKDMRLVIVGYLDLPDYFLKFIENHQVEIHPLQNYMNLQRLMAGVDINLIPLQVNDFTNCKSELKFFEAGIVKTVSIASPTYIYKEIIEDGKNGFIANQGEWVEKIQDLLEPENRQKIQNKVFDYSLDNYSGYKVVDQINQVYAALLS